jgi:hypothetical protein
MRDWVLDTAAAAAGMMEFCAVHTNQCKGAQFEQGIAARTQAMRVAPRYGAIACSRSTIGHLEMCLTCGAHL